jgi:hypothetical protein
MRVLHRQPRMSRSLSSGAHSRDPLAHPGYACCASSLRKQGPIATGVGLAKNASSISFDRGHNAVWVPAFAGTTWG